LSTALSFSVSSPRRSDLALTGESVLDQARGGRVAVLPSAWLSGQAQMQRQDAPPDPSWSVPLLVSLSRAGERGPAYVAETTSDARGAFTVTMPVGPGAYGVRLDGLHTLRNLLPGATLGAGRNTLNMATLLEGDANNDNRVNVQDVSLLAAAFGASSSQAGFNEDGAIGQDDLALLQANLLRRGDVLVSVGLASEQAAIDLPDTASPLTGGAVSLRLVPAARQVMAGQVMTLAVVASTGSQLVDSLEVYIDFDPSILALVDAAGQPAEHVIAGNGLQTVLLNQVDAARGRIGFIAASLNHAPISGDVAAAMLRFKVLKAGATWVRFSFSDWRGSAAAYQGVSLVGDCQAADIKSVAGNMLYLPVILKN
jgi:hypothetical protein